MTKSKKSTWIARASKLAAKSAPKAGPPEALRFFDASTWIGRPMIALPNGPAGASVNAEELLAEMDRSGIEKALVWHVAQRDHDGPTGNRLLAEAIHPHDRLFGCWAIYPPQTGELGDLDDFFAAAGEARVKAFRAFPSPCRFLLRADSMGDLWERMLKARVPLFLSAPRHVSWEAVYDLLKELPELRLVLSEQPNWGCDRYFRPLVERYPNVYVELSGYFVAGGLETFVRDYGAKQLLFGTNFPESYHGANMLAVAQADVSPADRAAIASGNLERLLGEVRL
jgi:predicted TIM-barrel fold metal-dependent hydrolase